LRSRWPGWRVRDTVGRRSRDTVGRRSRVRRGPAPRRRCPRRPAICPRPGRRCSGAEALARLAGRIPELGGRGIERRRAEAAEPEAGRVLGAARRTRDGRHDRQEQRRPTEPAHPELGGVLLAAGRAVHDVHRRGVYESGPLDTTLARPTSRNAPTARVRPRRTPWAAPRPSGPSCAGRGGRPGPSTRAAAGRAGWCAAGAP